MKNANKQQLATRRQLATQLSSINQTITRIERLANRESTPAGLHFELQGVLGRLQEAAGQLDTALNSAAFEERLNAAANEGAGQ